MMYGFYSAKHDQAYGSIIYLDPNGKEVNVTLVQDNDPVISSTYQWPDTVAVGEVVKYVRTLDRKLYDYGANRGRSWNK